MFSISNTIVRHALIAAVATSGVMAVTTPAVAQFQRTLGDSTDDRTEWTQQTADGGYITVGYRATQTYVAKTDAAGAMVWNTMLFSSNFVLGNRIVEVSDGYVIAGESNEVPGHGIFLAKLDLSGGLLWSYAYPGTPFAGGSHHQTALTAVGDDGFVLTGRIQNGNAQSAPIMIRTDASGTLQWAKYYIDTNYGFDMYGSFGDVDLYQIPGVVAGFVAGGWTANNVFGQRESLLVTFDNVGNPIWAKTYGDPAHSDFAKAVDPTDNRDILMSGFTKNVGEGGGTYMLRVDSAGTLLWDQTFRFFHVSNAMEELASGEIILGGDAVDNGLQASILKTNSAGNYQWGWSYGGVASEYGESVIPTSDGGFKVAAWTNTYGVGSFDWFMIKTDASGSCGCNETPYAPPLGVDQPPVKNVELEVIDIQGQEILELFGKPIPLEEDILCEGNTGCPGDLNGDAVVDIQDILIILAQWGQPGGVGDVNGDGIVNIADVLAILSAWGHC